MPTTTVRTITSDGNIDPVLRVFSLPAKEAVLAAYINDRYGASELVPVTDFHKQHHAEAKALVQESGTKPGVFHIILPNGRSWFGFPDE